MTSLASCSLQETLEDIDRNGDGHVDEDEYIGELLISKGGGGVITV